MDSEDDDRFVRELATNTSASRRSVERAYEKSGLNRAKTAERVRGTPCQYGASWAECSCQQHRQWRSENGY